MIADIDLDKWVRRASIAFACWLIVGTCFAQCEQQIIRLDWTGYPPAIETSPVAVTVDVINNQLWVNDGNGILRFNRNGSGAGGKKWVCPGSRCPGSSVGDYDWVCYNFSACTGCTWYVMSCWHSGSWVSSTDHSQIFEIDTSSEGAYTFSHGSSQYVVSTGWTAPGLDGTPVQGCGFKPNEEPTLWQITPAGFIRLQCLDFGFGNVKRDHQPPQFLAEDQKGRWLAEKKDRETKAAAEISAMLTDADSPEARSMLSHELQLALAGGGVVVLNGARLSADRITLVTDDHRLTTWQIIGSGTSLRLQKLGGPEPATGSHFGRGFEVRRTASSCLLVTSAYYESALWSCVGPELVKLTDLPHAGQLGGIASFSPDGELAYIAQMAGRWAQLYDISDPTKPVPVESGLDLPFPPPQTRRAHYDAEPWGRLELADFTVEAKVDVSECGIAIFSDGFESGDTGAWN